MKIKSYFENQQDVVISNLEKAQREVTILMAWLNFDIYGDTFAALLKRNVCLKILLDNNQSNFKYWEKIQKLKKLGAKILFYQYSGIMHIKDAVIDDRILLTGSFNWTKNANLRNREKLEVQEAENLYDKAQLVEEIGQFYRNCLVSTQVVNILKIRLFVILVDFLKWCWLCQQKRTIIIRFSTFWNAVSAVLRR